MSQSLRMSGANRLSSFDSDAVLVVRGLRVAARNGSGADKEIVRGVDFDLCAGETTALVGESGSGKSMTSLAVMGLLSRERFSVTGSVRLGGVELLSSADVHRSMRGHRLAMLFQEPLAALNPSFTVGAFMIETARLDPGVDASAARRRAIDCLERTGLCPGVDFLSRYPHQLSGGQRQRALLATALVRRPEILVADEPTSALDAPLVVEFLDLLLQLQKDLGLACLLITHDMRVVASAADRTHVIYDGEIVESGRTLDILCRPIHPYSRALIERRSDPFAIVARTAGTAGDESVSGCRFRMRCPIAVPTCADVHPEERSSGGRTLRCFVREHEL